MKEEVRKYIAVVIVVAAVAIVFFLTGKQQLCTTNKIEIKKISNPILPRSQAPERAIYSIDNIKKPSVGRSVEEINDLEALYKKYPSERTGENVIEKWSQVKVEDKAELSKGITEAIKKSEGELRINPNDQRAKSKLVISQMLQKLISSNFKYKVKELEESHGR